MRSITPLEHEVRNSPLKIISKLAHSLISTLKIFVFLQLKNVDRFVMIATTEKNAKTSNSHIFHLTTLLTHKFLL